MPSRLFPERIETDRLRFVRISHDTIDPYELYEFVSGDEWREDATEHMPWFRFDRLDHVATFIDHAEKQWNDLETARYVLRTAGDGSEGQLVGLTGYGPEWEERRAGSGVVLAPAHWGNGYGRERASVFVELTFDRYDLDAYYSTCATGNDRSRRMIRAYVERYGGRHDGLLRQHSARPNGEVTDQHRFSITRDEYEAATADSDTLDFELAW